MAKSVGKKKVHNLWANLETRTLNPALLSTPWSYRCHIIINSISLRTSVLRKVSISQLDDLFFFGLGQILFPRLVVTKVVWYDTTEGAGRGTVNIYIYIYNIYSGCSVFGIVFAFCFSPFLSGRESFPPAGAPTQEVLQYVRVPRHFLTESHIQHRSCRSCGSAGYIYLTTNNFQVITITGDHS